MSGNTARRCKAICNYGIVAPSQSTHCLAEIIEESARLTIERIVGSDALYHDAYHTTLVTLVAQDILRGRFVSLGVGSED